jgi:hypothetical protein
VRLAVVCRDDCSLAVRGVLLVRRRGGGPVLRSIRLSTSTVELEGGRPRRLSLTLDAAAHRALRSALARGRQVRAVVAAVARDGAGTEHELKARSAVVR